MFCVVRVSGTIKKCEQEAIRRARGAILRAKGEGSEATGVLRAVLSPFVEEEAEGVGIGIDGEMENHSGGE